MNPADGLPPQSAYAGMKQAALLESPPFSEYAKLILKVSLNYGANSLLPLMAVHEGKSTFEDGLQIEHAFLEKAGVNLDGLIINDGEGGPGKDYISAECVVQLLRHMSTSKDFKAFEDALPIMGVDGSPSGLLGDKSPIKGKVRAKTGTHATGDLLNQRVALTARALAGYMTASSGRKLAFDVSATMIIPEGKVDMEALLNKHASILEAIYEEY
jgi:D-alanyl-D-alanine carboxypeptidase/D-alanyl-D-alanine-endopeptidase (penicillin-binding protein 4)